MPLEKNFDKVITPKEEGRRVITKLTELDESDEKTIYNLIFRESRSETKES